MPALQTADTTKLGGKAKELLAEFENQAGLTPNILKQMGNSPAALEAFLSVREIMSKGLLSSKLRALIGITIAESYSCEYMLSARVALAQKAGLTDEEIRLAKEQTSKDPKEDAGLSFVRNLVLRHGELPDGDVAELKKIGYSDGEIVELIFMASMDMMVYYFVQIAQPEADFPRVATAFPV